jgi:hypothetical protein
MNGVALADLNRDGLIDIVATYSEPELRPKTGRGTQLRVFLNEGNFRFREHQLSIDSQTVTPQRFGARAQVPVLADFNRDGFLDMLVTRNAPMKGGRIARRAKPLGNTLLVSEGRWDTFADLSVAMGIRNERAYNRQAAFGDVDRDGWLDIAVGSDNIGDADGGLPISRLYVFRPKDARFEHGRFDDIGGTTLVPDFGGYYHDSDRDKAGPDINLADLDNDADLDLVQSYHVDCRQPGLPYSPCEYRQGIFVWKNVLAEAGRLRFAAVTDNGLAEVGRLKYDRKRMVYDPVQVGPGLPYLSLADVDNDSLLDVVAVGPSDPGWSPRAEDVGGRFWYNTGGFRFRQATDESGLSALNWTYRQWDKLFDLPVPASGRRANARHKPTIAQPGLLQGDPFDGRPHYGDAVFADVDNDGWMDLIVPDRSGKTAIEARAMLFMNRGNGTFEPKPTTFSGLDSRAINVEVADLDNDGLLDLVFAADPDNSTTTRGIEQYESKIYRNTGRYGARQNHWLRMRFAGVSDAALIGSRIEVRADGASAFVATRTLSSNHSYKSGSPLEAHCGLGKHAIVDVSVVLAGGRRVEFRRLRADRFLTLDLERGTTADVPVR